MNLRLVLLLGLIYGLGFMLVKSIFPEPFIILLLQGNSSEGNLTTLALVYMASGLAGGLIAAPIFGAFLARGRESRRVSASALGPRFFLSIGLALVAGLISAGLTLLAYGTGVLTGGVLDPLKIIAASNFPTGTPLLILWTIARDLLPAGLAGLFLAPICGELLQRLYAEPRPLQKDYDWGD